MKLIKEKYDELNFSRLELILNYFLNPNYTYSENSKKNWKKLAYNLDYEVFCESESVKLLKIDPNY